MWKYILAGYLAVMNLVTFFVYGSDKKRAREQRYRIPEKRLFLLAAIGGPVGALLGMIVFHHKNRKARFWLWNEFCLAVWAVAIIALVF